MKKLLRPGRKWTDIIPVAAVLSIVLLILGSIMSGVILNLFGLRDLVRRICGSDDIAVFMFQYLGFIGIWGAMLLFILMKGNRPMWKAFWYNGKGNNGRGLLFGILLGFGANALCVLLSYLKGDIRLSFHGIDPVLVLTFFAAIFIQSGAEELVDRLYLYQKLRRRYRSPLVAIFVNSLVFMALHMANPGFTFLAGCQIALIGVLFSLLVYYYDSLWAAIGFHAAWNYTQNILFGLPNSGIVSAYSVFRLDAASARNGLFYNVGFGVEGSIGASLVLLLIIAAIYYVNRGKGEKTDLWATEPSAAPSRSENAVPEG